MGSRQKGREEGQAFGRSRGQVIQREGVMRSTVTRSTQQPAHPASRQCAAPMAVPPTSGPATAIPDYSVGTTIPVTAPDRAPIQMMNAPPVADGDDDERWDRFRGRQPARRGAEQRTIADEDWGPFQGAGDQQVVAPNNVPPAPVAADDWQPNFPPIADGGQPPVVAAQNQPAPNHGPHVDTGQSQVSNGPMHTTGLAQSHGDRRAQCPDWPGAAVSLEYVHCDEPRADRSGR